MNTVRVYQAIALLGERNVMLEKWGTKEALERDGYGFAEDFYRHVLRSELNSSSYWRGLDMGRRTTSSKNSSEHDGRF